METREKREVFPTPTQAQLDGLGEGCFAAVSSGDNGYCWVEILTDNGEELIGKVHAELAVSGSQQCDADNQQLLSFHKDQVVYLGCDRYCFC